jgi:hypothetical protein
LINLGAKTANAKSESSRWVREAFELAEKAHRELETRPTFSTAVLDVLEPPLETNGSD